MAHTDPILRSLLDRIANEQNLKNHILEIAPTSTDGANYTSKLFHATIKSNGNKNLNLFCKVAAIGNKIRGEHSLKIYDTERLFYTKLAKVYRKIEHDHGVPEEHRMVVPKFYGCNATVLEEIIVLDNLSRNGFTTHDRLKSVEWEYAAAAVGELAKLHALSIAYQHERPEEFDQLMHELENAWGTNESKMTDFWDKVVAGAMVATKDENKAKLKSFFENTTMKTNSEAFKNYLAPLRRAVIAHCDYRPSNLMHKVHDDGRVQVIPVDFQTMQGGSPVVDLLYFIFTGSDEQFRAQHYQRLLDHYHAQLSLALRRLHLDPDEKYSREDFDYELKQKLPFGLAVAVFTLPVVTVEAEHAPKVNEELDLSSFSIQNTSKLFPERLNGVVNDFVKWGILK